jgi:sec-independent protein translocase protein TatA
MQMTANILGSDGLIVLIVAVVVLFGGSQLPKLAKNVGAAGHEFRRAQREAEADHANTEAARSLAAAVAPAAPAPLPTGSLAPSTGSLAPSTGSLTPSAGGDDRLVMSRSDLQHELARLMQAREQPTVG